MTLQLPIDAIQTAFAKHRRYRELADSIVQHSRLAEAALNAIVEHRPDPHGAEGLARGAFLEWLLHLDRRARGATNEHPPTAITRPERQAALPEACALLGIEPPTDWGFRPPCWWGMSLTWLFWKAVESAGNAIPAKR